MGKVSKREKNSDEGKPGAKEKLAKALELPKEILLNIPKIVLLGNKSVVIENYKGILLFEDDTIKVNTNSGILGISGRKLKITEINADDLLVEGRIKTIEFMNQ